MSDTRIDDLFDEISALLGDDVLNETFNDENVPSVMDIDARIKILEEYALKKVNCPAFDPTKDYIRFRKIRLLKLNRVHSLLVDVIKDKRRYTAALKKRISTGERDPKKWVRDVNEAVEIALSSKPVALCAVENRIEDYSRGVVEVFYDDDRDLSKGIVFVWGTTIADCKGPISNVIDILERLHVDDTVGLTIKSSSKEGLKSYDTEGEEWGVDDEGNENG